MSRNAALFVVDGLHVSVEGKEIVKGLDLTIQRGEIHAIMGPNASGKSTLANALMGHPRYEVTQGRVLLKGENILGLKPDERARRGLFLAFQYPRAIPGVSMVNFLRSALRAVRGSDVPVREFRAMLQETMSLLKMDEDFARRYINDGFSGGEMKRAEVLQMGILQPEMAILDETDSGLDIDALRTVSEGINALADDRRGFLIITHYQRILNYVRPHFVHVLFDGRIIKSGGPELAQELEAEGYERHHRRVRRRAGGRQVSDRKAADIVSDGYKWGFHDEARYLFRTERGLSPQGGRGDSRHQGGAAVDARLPPPLPRDLREEADADLGPRPLRHQPRRHVLLRPRQRPGRSATGRTCPTTSGSTFDRLGIPEAERKFLAGVGAQYDSEVVYHNIREELAKQGVIFVDTDTAVREYPDLVRQYFGTIVPPADNKFAALNSAVWSGGSFIYVPEGVQVDVPLQAYFRINAENIGQFERTLIIAEPGSFVHYIEGCTAPIYTTNSLHAAVVEVIVKKGARVRYSTVQNWSNNVYNLVTKRAAAYEDAVVEWVDGNLGSKADDEVPGALPHGAGRARRGALAELRRPRSAPGRRRQGDPRRAAHHLRHHVEVGQQGRRPGELSRPGEGASRARKASRSSVRCDALLLDEDSRSDTYPTMEIDEQEASGQPRGDA